MSSSSTRGTICGGFSGSATNKVEFITLASQGNGIDYGDLTQARWNLTCANNSVKGFWAGGYDPSVYNIIDTLVINNGGTATDAGDLVSARNDFWW